MASTWQYWRVLFNGPTNGGGSNAVAITELALYDGDMNALSLSGVTATASSTLSSNVASNAKDANLGTLWASTAQPSSGSPQWLQYQFGAAVTASFLSLTSSFGSADTQSPTAFLVQGSPDGTTWTTIQTYTGVAWFGGNTQPQLFSASTTVGIVRASAIQVETAYVGATARLSQLQREVIGGSNPNARASQVQLEVLSSDAAHARISQIVVEIIYPYAQSTPNLITVCLLP